MPSSGFGPQRLDRLDRDGLASRKVARQQSHTQQHSRSEQEGGRVRRRNSEEEGLQQAPFRQGHPDTQHHDELFSARTTKPAAATAAPAAVAATADPVEARVRVALAAAEAAIDAMGDADWPAAS